MRRSIASIVLAVLVIWPASAGLLIGRGGSVGANSVPVMVAGAAVPQSEDNANPSMSRWNPSCLDATWGTGCNTSTETCTAPSGGTPVETCQPPLQLYVTGGSGNGTTATIDYHSEAGYTFPVGTPLMISGALQTAWNTPIGKITSLSFTHNGTKCISATDWCATIGFGSTSFISGTPIYVGGLSGSLGSTQLKWDQVGFGANITAGSCCSGGILSVTIDNPIFGTTPSVGDYIIGSLTFSAGSCTGPLTCVLNTRYTLQSSSGGGTVLNFTAPSGAPTVTINGGYMSYEVGAQGPNGKWTPDAISGTAASYDINASFPNGIDGTFGGLNQGGYNGTATQPWPVTASTCGIGGNPKSCSVSFAHPTACASSCVTVETAQSTSGTQIVAGQFAEPVMAWDSGPAVPLAIQGDINNPNTPVELCVAADHISGVRGVWFSLDGGTPIESTTAILDPWGVGGAYNTNDPYNSGVVNNTYVYCAQFLASSVADGEHEVRAWAVGNAGPMGQLTSAITADATNGSATLASISHHLSHNYRVAVTQSVDPNYPIYNGANYGATLTLASPYATYSSGNVTYTYILGTNLAEPLGAGTLVNITGVTNNNSCPISGGSTTGAQITYNYTGGCSFPVGSTVNIAGIPTPTAQSVAISNIAYNSGTGDLAITLGSAAWGTTPGYQYITQFTISGATGTGSSSVNGAFPLQSYAGSGTILHFTIATGLSISASGGNIVSNTYSWNGNAVPVVATNGSSTITVAGLATSLYPGSGGTITENWNLGCAVSAAQTATSPYSITCPVPNAASATVTSGATASIQVNSNVLCVNGGPGDEPAPYDPAFEPSSVMTPVHFEALPQLPNSCSIPGVSTNVGVGCHAEPCGILASKNSTLWFYRKDAGTLEQADYNLPIKRGNDGSFFVLTNAHGAMQERNSYVDSWNPSSALSSCSSGPSDALAWNATRPTYGGNYCANASYARSDLVYGNPYNTFEAATVTGDAPSCLVFTNATYFTNFYAGEAVAFSGIDAGAAGDGSNGVLNAGQSYFVYANLGSGQIELSRTGSLASCITAPSHTTIASAKLSPDFSNTNVFFKCNTSLGCSASNPEQVVSNAQPFSSTQYAKLGWFSLLPDTANGTTQHEVDLFKGCIVNCAQLSTTQGRIRGGLDRSPQNFVITPSNTIGPTRPVTTANGGSLSGTCNGADPSCQETLTWAAETNCADVYAACTTNGATAATFQPPNSASGHDMPGQNIVVSGLANGWNCGTGSAPCVVLSSTATSVTFINSTATSTYSGTGVITPLSLSIELPQGTFPNISGSPNCGNASFQAITPIAGNTMCLASTATNNFNGVAAGLWPVELGTQEWVDNSNCVITNNGATSAYPIYVQSVTVNTGDLDVLTIGTRSTVQPVWAYNACPTFELSYGGFAGQSTIESWDSGNTINGPNFWEQTGSPYVFGSNTENGVSYVTNVSRYNSNGPSDYTGYTWGFSSIYNVGNCHNDGGTAFHVRCIAYHTAATTALGGGGATNPPSIIHSYDTYADYLANSPILCGGVDCVTTSSRLFVLSDNGSGTVPNFGTLNQNVSAFCQYGSTTVPLVTMLGLVDVTWYDRTHNVFQVSNAPVGCNPITSAIAFFGVTFHPDTVFWNTGPWYTSTPIEFATRGQWIVVGNVFLSQVDTTGNGDTEGLFSEGGSYQNMAFENGTMQSIRVPQSGQLGQGSGVYLGSYGNVNWLIKGNNMYAATSAGTSYNANTFPSWYQQAPLGNLFWLNNNFGTVALFPYSDGYTPAINGQFSLSGDYWDDYSEISGFGNTTFTMFNTAGWFPSEAWGVNASGTPVHAGQPSLYSLNESPWHTSVTGDSGLGLQ